MEEALSLSSSHLTYHLDALKELVTKTETGYKLSVFGQAAVEMIERVENPPQEIAKRHLRYKQISIIHMSMTKIRISQTSIGRLNKAIDKHIGALLCQKTKDRRIATRMSFYEQLF